MPPRMLLIEQVAQTEGRQGLAVGHQVSLTGMARELGGREAIAAALKNLPRAIRSPSNEITAPPYMFQANKDPVAAP